MSKNVGIGRNYEVPDDWMVTTIESNIIDIGDGGTPDTNFQRYFGGNIRWAKVDDIEFKISDTKNHLTQEGLDNSSAKLWPEGSVIVTTGATIGKVGISQEPIATKQGITGIVTNHNLESRYLAYFLISEKKTLVRFAQGGTFEEIRPHILKRLRIPLPPLPEQRRIAEILSTVDELIQQTDAIIGETERLKRGLMQDLLTRGIGHESYKTVQIGPKQYTIPEKWKVTCLDNVGNVITGRTPPTDDARNYEGNIPFITPADLGRHKYVKNTNKSLTTKGLKETREVKSGAVTVVCIGSTIGKIGLAHTLSATNQQINSICPNEKHSSEYLYYAILLFTNILISRAGVAVIPIVNKADFSRLPIIIPPLVEQKYIAQILSTVDRDLATKRKSKKFLASLKRGLMQDLLTGKVRVPVET